MCHQRRRATEKWGFHPLKYHFCDLKTTWHAQEAMQLADAAWNNVDMTNIQKTDMDPTPPTKPSIPILLLPDLLMQTNSWREGSWGSSWQIGCYRNTSDREQNGHRVSSQPSWSVSHLDGNIWSGNWPVLNAIMACENIDICWKSEIIDQADTMITDNQLRVCRPIAVMTYSIAKISIASCMYKYIDISWWGWIPHQFDLKYTASSTTALVSCVKLLH